MRVYDEKSLVVITGPTATGKTKLSAKLASRLDGEIISADSRQVYRGMDIGTGKDLGDYVAEGEKIPYHLVDIREPGYEYNVYEFQNDFLQAFEDISDRGKLPILCGGTGLYIEAAISGYRFISVPENKELRKELSDVPMDKLVEMLSSMKKLHNTTDITDRERLVRALEIAIYEIEHNHKDLKYPRVNPILFALHFERAELRRRITERLEKRIEKDMIQEVRELLNSGLDASQLRFYGLEYRFVTDYITGALSYNEMFNKLNTAIHQFAKRQMTWFRRMERKGYTIHWIAGSIPEEDKVQTVFSFIKNYTENR